MEFGDPRLWNEDPIIDDRKIALEMVLKKTGDSMQYEYDLGDGWMHAIKLEEINRDEERVFRKPVCVDGENAAPPEDVGGVQGFREFREVIADPDCPEYKSYRQWGVVKKMFTGSLVHLMKLIKEGQQGAGRQEVVYV